MMQESNRELDIDACFVEGDDTDRDLESDTSPTMPATPRALLLEGARSERRPS